MKAIYNTCVSDPFLKVAIQLCEKYNIEPIYWIGYHNDASEQDVQITFPDIIYHRYYDAWTGILPEKTRHFADETPEDIDFINSHCFEEINALSIMDRMDPDRFSFPFAERQMLYRKYIRYWTGFIKSKKPDVLISAIYPHRIYDYPLYALCRHFGIKIISFYPVSIPSRIIPINSIDNFGTKIKEKYRELISSPNADLSLSKDIEGYFQKLRGAYDTASPYYIKINANRDKQTSNVFKAAWVFLKNPKFYNEKNTKILFHGIELLFKQKNKDVEDSKRYPFIAYMRILLKKRLMQKRLRKFYDSIAQKPDLTQKYIYFAMHYQPEASTTPIGGVFTEQLMAIRQLSAAIPDNWKIYVKENFYQFVNYSHGHLGRIKKHYTDALSIPKVVLVPTSIPSFELADNAMAVSTITGTVGIESVVRGKPVIVFGLTWVEDFDGVLKITSNKDAERIMPFIQSFVHDEHKVNCYIKAFDMASVYAYHYPGKKLRFNMDEELCVKNLIESIAMQV
ncbi:MAG TPA: hypothetical protein PLK75_01020 [Bacteroidales bacterium]|nr:hypothetical protein [Bacteroidales bacterium]